MMAAKRRETGPTQEQLQAQLLAGDEDLVQYPDGKVRRRGRTRVDEPTIHLQEPGSGMTFPSVGAAVRWATESSPLRLKAVNPAGGSGGYSKAEQLEAYSQILAILGALDDDDHHALVLYLHRNSYEDVARWMGKRRRRVERMVRRANEEVRARLIRARLLLDVGSDDGPELSGQKGSD